MPNTTGIDAVSENFVQAFQDFATVAASAGTSLAHTLAILSLALAAIMMVLQGDELNKMFSKFIQIGLMYGLFFTLIANASTWVPAIINSFMAIGGKSSGLGSLTPSSVFSVGTNIANKMFSLSNEVAIYHIGVILAGLFCGFFVLIIYALITAEVVIVLIKSYALIAMAPIIFALGNSDFTRSSVMNYVRKVIGLGIQLMMLYVIVGVGNRLGDLWIDQFLNAGYMDFLIAAVLPMLGGLIVLYLVMKNVPAFIAEVSGAGGFKNYGDAAIAAAFAGSAALTQAMKGMDSTTVGGIKGVSGVAGGIKGFGDGFSSGASDYYKKAMEGKPFLKNIRSGVYHGVKAGGSGLKKGGFSAFQGVADGTGYAHDQINKVRKNIHETVTGKKD
ncbi:P-type conjugative transfer protein TrbL [Francisella sp. TX07-6608]|uniref:P-type conjugative transfer protein TrbL n=1 Tax=Francisella sp. TX07-6608 TaxID=573568 RepID=UPI0008F9A7D9|nr:P-type conjugative transfer protein TrbL [Francisella sp. TX07-6608]OIN82942.1 P-type conjugative transfer protein TrbL [Francisella sp. TX07-6608]